MPNHGYPDVAVEGFTSFLGFEKGAWQGVSIKKIDDLGQVAPTPLADAPNRRSNASRGLTSFAIGVVASFHEMELE